MVPYIYVLSFDVGRLEVLALSSCNIISSTYNVNICMPPTCIYIYIYILQYRVPPLYIHEVLVRHITFHWLYVTLHVLLLYIYIYIYIYIFFFFIYILFYIYIYIYIYVLLHYKYSVLHTYNILQRRMF